MPGVSQERELRVTLLASVIIPAYNAEATLGQCLEACLAQTYPDVEVIVVDDGSSDATPRIAKGFPVHYVRQENRGPAAARNQGAAAAQGEILVYTDADCVPGPDWVARLVTGFSEGVGAVGGAYGIANPERLLARMVHEEIAARHARFTEEVDFLGSFNVAYLREAFEAAGGFDETFTHASAEDNDLAYRLADQGYSLRFVPEARVAHFHPTRLWPYLRTQMGHGFWRVRLYQKHPGRARQGDRYAGVTDLVAPPLALLVLAAVPVVLVSAFVPSAFGIAAIVAMALFGAYLILHLPLPLRMVKRTGDPRMALFLVVAALRDLARAVGMVHGFGHFALRRKERP